MKLYGQTEATSLMKKSCELESKRTQTRMLKTTGVKSGLFVQEFSQHTVSPGPTYKSLVEQTEDNIGDKKKI